MDGHAMTSMNARMVLASVTHTQHVQTLKDLTNVTAFLGFVEMVKCVEMSTNVWMIHMTADRIRLVGILLVPSPVRVMLVSVVVVIYALTSMSAVMEVIFVTFMPPVLTSLVHTSAPATKATTKMDD